MLPQPLLTVDEVAVYLKAPITTVRRWTRKKVIPGIKLGGEWRYDEEDLLSYLKKVRKTPVLK